MPADANGFDYIIVGSGAGGAPLAARLALRFHELGLNKQILVIEAGPSHTVADTPEREVSLVPGFHGLSTEHPKLAWQFFVEHYATPPTGEDPKRYRPKPGEPKDWNGIFYPRSSGIGGCTVHNAMITIAGPDSDWEDLADYLVDDSWRADVMRGYFERLERNEYLPPPTPVPSNWWRRQWENFRWLIGRTPDYARGKHGFDGWLHTSFTDLTLGLGDGQLKGVLGGALVQARRAGLDRAWRFVSSFLRGNAWFLAGLDPNHANTQANSPEGVAFVPLAVCGQKTTIHQNAATPFVMRGRRSSPREFLLAVQRQHPDRLTIWTDTLVTRVLFEPGSDPDDAGPRAVGVEFQRGARLYNATKPYTPDEERPPDGETGRVFVNAGGEIVLAGGSFNTPQLLMLSGIGDEQHLQATAIAEKDGRLCTIRDRDGKPLAGMDGKPLRIDLPGVGCNLQDRYEVSLIAEMREDFSLLEGATFKLPDGGRPDRHLERWRKKGTGLYTSNGAVLGIFKRSNPDLDQPDLFIFGIPLPFKGYEVGYSQVGHIHNHFTWAILKGHTKNTGGTVRLRSTNPRDVPLINFHYFNEQTGDGDREIDQNEDPDLLALVEGVKFVRGIFRHTQKYPLLFWSLGPRLGTEVHPGEKEVPRDDDQAVRDWIRRVAWGHHACGTCRMGPDGDERAVLDSRFRVRHVDGLRVVDASIFPKIPGYFIVTDIYMASEKAADVLLEDAVLRGADSATYPFALARDEAKALGTRRENIAEPPLTTTVMDERTRAWSPDVTGLALSGGGVRSATFNLGVLQAMAACRWLRRVDFLSTVSGGGYIGSFLGRWFDRLRPPSEWTGGGGKTPEIPDRIERELNDPAAPALRWLRSSGNYIAPQGDGDARTDAAVVVRNFLSVYLVVGALLFTMFGLLDWLRYRWFDPVFALALLGNPTASETTTSGALAAWTTLINALASPWFLIAGLVALFTAVPKMAAYWIVSEDRHGHFSGPPLAALFAIIVGLLLMFWTGLNAVALIVALSLLTAFFHAELAWYRARQREAALGRGDVNTQRLRTRNHLTTELGGSLRLIFAALVFAIIDSLGHLAQQYTAGNRTYIDAFAAAGAIMMALMPLAHKAANLFARDPDNAATGLTRFVKQYIAAGVLAAVLFTLPLVIVAFAAHAAFDGGSNIPRGVALTLFAGLLSIIFAHPRAITFVNRSSLAPVYAARLARAYLGATNPVRHRPEGANITEVVAGDDVASIREYAPYRTGGPLHLINMTVNQTIEFTSQRGNRDRKGENLAVSSLAMSIGRRWHAAWRDRTGTGLRPDEHKRLARLEPIGHLRGSDHPLVDETGNATNRAQNLSLRQWVAISGAAVGPGQGQTTKLGTALLYGLANLRTGYWWNSGISRPDRDGFPAVTFFRRLGYFLQDIFLTQTLLLSEWIAHFPGPWNRYWYLSDGGSFEVLGGYELIRRRVPRIIVSDASADPKYDMDSVANLMRKARLDFDARIEPFTAADIAAHVPSGVQGAIGTLDDLRAGAAAGAVSRKHAALFWIRYARELPPSVMLYVKASVTGDESTDVLEYRSTHPEFPHEPTEDQFFDEEQWESYRALGRHVMSPLCGGRWFWDIPLRSEDDLRLEAARARESDR
jgi:choline dehydrogenase-like flavoprotein